MVSPGLADTDRVAVLCGPTAIGKTALSIALAERLDAEIIAADSRTIYRGMDIGTAKPTAEQRRRVPHHLLDVVDPRTPCTVADFQILARQALDDIRRRDRVALIVGGSGLYVQVVVDDWTIPPVPADPELRRLLQEEDRVHGAGHLHARLAAVDATAAARIHPHNVRRLIRALEVALQTGRPISEQQRHGASRHAAVMVGLTMARAALHARIDARIEQQLADGLVDETRRLLHEGVPVDAQSMQGLGHKEIAGWLSGSYAYDEALRRLRRNTRLHAKRQLTWFRRDSRVRWMDLTDVSQGDVTQRAHAIMDAELSTRPRRN
jgi:tRNA dimethylallyltransferase